MIRTLIPQSKHNTPLVQCTWLHAELKPVFTGQRRLSAGKLLTRVVGHKSDRGIAE